MFSRARLAACAFALVTLAGAAAEAQPAPDVEIRCDALDAEGRDALEARARVDLATRGISGKVTVSCDAARVDVSLGRSGVDPLHHVERLPPERNAAVDAALGAIDALFGEAVPPRPPVAPPRLGLIPPPSPEPPPPAPVPPPALVPPPRPPALWLAVGGDFQLWAGSGAIGAAGPYVAARFVTSSVAFELQGGARFAISVPAALSVRLGEGLAGADATMPFAPWLSLGAGIGFAYLVAVRETTSQPSLSSAAMVGRLRARAALDLGEFDLHLGPELRVLAPPTLIQIDGRDVVRAPSVSVGLALDIGARVR